MTSEEINKRIAIACGARWKFNHSCQFKFLGFKHEGFGDADESIPDCIDAMDGIPNYHGDLNAMHDAVMSLPSGLKEHSFRRALAKAVGVAGIDDWAESLVCLDKLTNATAPQRAEAFLRTIGQWEDGK